MELSPKKENLHELVIDNDIVLPLHNLTDVMLINRSVYPIRVGKHIYIRPGQTYSYSASLTAFSENLEITFDDRFSLVEPELPYIVNAKLAILKYKTI